MTCNNEKCELKKVIDKPQKDLDGHGFCDECLRGNCKKCYASNCLCALDNHYD